MNPEKMNKNHLGLNGVENLRNKDLLVITPENAPDAKIQATWMIELLEEVYGQHAITNSRKTLEESIESGETKCWFSLDKNGLPLATTALIDLGDRVEIGRGAARIRGNGIGKNLILKAVNFHRETDNRPLVGEVRIAKKFKGVPGSIATQKICFGELGFKPHAIIPAFEHGNPPRTEFFAFSTIQDRIPTENILIPPCMSKSKQNISTLAGQIFETTVTKVRADKKKESAHFKQIQTEPFSLFTKSSKEEATHSLEEVAATTLENRFTLIPIEASAENVNTLHQLWKNRFDSCGVDSVPGPNNHPVLLMGNIRKETTLAPVFESEFISNQLRQSMKSIESDFKKQAASIKFNPFQFY